MIETEVPASVIETEVPVPASVIETTVSASMKTDAFK
jgi:hypothetical protein